MKIRDLNQLLDKKASGELSDFLSDYDIPTLERTLIQLYKSEYKHAKYKTQLQIKMHQVLIALDETLAEFDIHSCELRAIKDSPQNCFSPSEHASRLYMAKLVSFCKVLDIDLDLAPERLTSEVIESLREQLEHIQEDYQYIQSNRGIDNASL